MAARGDEKINCRLGKSGLCRGGCLGNVDRNRITDVLHEAKSATGPRAVAGDHRPRV